jgi:glycosyltransferase involved in cell wall biosynthesis
MKILYLASHLSTGGMPSFLLKRVKTIQEYSKAEIFVVEFKNYSNEYVVQKNEINKLTKIITLGEDKMELMSIIKSLKIDVVHIEEMIEGFDGHNTVPKELMNALYSKDRSWRIVETCHNVWFNPDVNKLYHPDAYAFCTPYHLTTFKNMTSPKEVIQFPIDNNIIEEDDKFLAAKSLGFNVNKSHVVNVGLWTPGKNQAEAIEVAKLLPNIDFHFVGNQAINFKE